MENVGVALLLVVGAGSATALGAMVVFFPFLVKYAKTRTLAGALGLSAGVMTYVSFVEIFKKSNKSFVAAGHDEAKAHIYATGCFFCGVVLMVMLNYGVTLLLGGHHHHHHSDSIFSESTNKKQQKTQSELSRGSSNLQNQNNNTSVLDVVNPCMCCSEDPAGELAAIQQRVQEEITINSNENPIINNKEDNVIDSDADEEQQRNDAPVIVDEEKLMRMSINTALAIGLHNFPEGLATFVATLNDPKVGVVLATAIAIHNIPEGLCVAMPIYYATGNRWKAFRWGVLSGLSEPIAALLGWAVLARSFSETLYAVMFGIVAGMMVIISARELLPTAHRYDPEDTVVTYSFIGGMFIMALSLVLFLL